MGGEAAGFFGGEGGGVVVVRGKWGGRSANKVEAPRSHDQVLLCSDFQSGDARERELRRSQKIFKFFFSFFKPILCLAVVMNSAPMATEASLDGVVFFRH